jgi:lipoprotein-releasing system permease protein
MGFSLALALRYLGSKKRAFISVGTMFATIGVALGVAALATVMSVTGGFRAEFRQKVLGVNAHVLILKYASDFSEYREIMKQMEHVPHVIGIGPFVINPMMVTHRDRTATGVLLKGVDPALMPQVLDLPRHVVAGSLEGLRLPDAKPAERRKEPLLADPFSITPTRKGKKGKSGGERRQQRPFLDLLREEVERSEVADAGVPGADSGRGEQDSDAESAGLLPPGSIVPDGGYEGELPDDAAEDAIFEKLYPDPCDDPRAVQQLPGIVIGITLKENLGVDLGDCVQVTSPTIGYTFTRGAIRAPVAKRFRVIAVFDAGFDQYDAKLVYTDLYEAQTFYDSGDSVTGVEMKVDDIDRASAVTREVDERLGSGLYHTLDWEELNHGLFTALRIQQILMSLVLALIIVVAAFTVIATLIMMVLDKKREIAVLKAMGATNAALLRAFLYQGAIIGVVGTTIGLALGLAVCKGLLVYGFPLDPKVYFISRLPVQVRPAEFVLVGVFSLVVCLVATVWPALYAAHLRPAEAFREQ